MALLKLILGFCLLISSFKTANAWYEDEEVDCGWHKAMTCSGCPQFPMWCTKDCFWEIDEDGKDGKCIDDPDYLEDCAGDLRCTNENETCVAELISTFNYTMSLYADCSETMKYNDPDNEEEYAPLWQECFCISKNPPEFQRVDYEDLPEDLM